MKSYLKLSILSILAVGSLAQAGTFREAAAVCESMSFQSGKNTCFGYISSVKAEYFNAGAIQVCQSMSFDSGKNLCVVNITSKEYESFEISNCLGLSFDSEKNTCLQSFGEVVTRRPQPVRPIPDRPHYPDNGQSQDYVRGSTVVWENKGVYRAPKALVQEIQISFDSYRGVSDVRLAATKAPVRIVRAHAITMSGQYLDLRHLEATVGEDSHRLLRLNDRFAVRLQKLVLEVTSPDLIGSQGRLEVVVGVTN